MQQSDAAFFIGKTHTVCEDYAFAPSGTSASGQPFHSVWLSDGCSSSPQTDIGARLLVHTMQSRIEAFEAVHGSSTTKNRQAALDQMVCGCVTDAQQMAVCIGVPKNSLDATLLGLVKAASPNGDDQTLYAFLYGDGALVLGLDDGTRVIYRGSYQAGYPFYPAYLEDARRLSQWQKVPDNTYHILQTTLSADGVMQKQREIMPLAASVPYYLLRRPVAGLRFAALLSDGIESFQRRTETASFESVPYLDVVKELTAFKQFTGEFVKRRMHAFEKACAGRLGWHHNDDLSMAAMAFEE